MSWSTTFKLLGILFIYLNLSNQSDISWFLIILIFVLDGFINSISLFLKRLQQYKNYKR
jgi:hypothetical protein